MAFHPVPQTVEIKFKGDRSGDPRITVFHYRYGPAGGPRPTDAELDDLLASIIANVHNRFILMCTPGTRWTSVTAQDIHDAAGRFRERVLNPILTGARAGDSLPGNVQLCLAKKGAGATRASRGRMFIPDLMEGDQSDSNIGTALQPLVLDLAAALLLSRGSLRNFVPVVASKKYQLFSTLLGVTFDLITDSMRTRLKGHKRRRRRPAVITGP